jgi:hypothetical protein
MSLVGVNASCLLEVEDQSSLPSTSSSQVVRQRDTLRQLLESSGSNLDAARTAYAQSLAGDAPSPSQQQQHGAPSPAPGGTPSANGAAAAGAAPGPDYRGLHADLEQQFKEYKEEAAKTHDMLGKDVSGWGLQLPRRRQSRP